MDTLLNIAELKGITYNFLDDGFVFTHAQIQAAREVRRRSQPPPNSHA
jgi:hypothetical protein